MNTKQELIAESQRLTEEMRNLAVRIDDFKSRLKEAGFRHEASFLDDVDRPNDIAKAIDDITDELCQE